LPEEPTPTARHWVQYIAMRLSEITLGWLPWGPGRRVARAMGSLAFMLDGGERKKDALDNIRRAFPQMGEAEARRLLRECYRWLVESLFDFRKFEIVQRRGWAGRLVTVEGGENLDRLPGDTGIIFVTGHLGIWEVLGLATNEIGLPVLSFARPRSNPLIERRVNKLRQSTGQKVLPKRGSMRAAVEALRSGRNLAALADQDARKYGVFVEFFGRPASTITSVARLSYFTGAPVVFAYGRRAKEGIRFRFIFTDPIFPNRDAPVREEVLRITQAFTTALEKAVREEPAQWLWIHRRWKTYPGKYRDRDGAGRPGAARQRWGNRMESALSASEPDGPQDGQ